MSSHGGQPVGNLLLVGALLTAACSAPDVVSIDPSAGTGLEAELDRWLPRFMASARVPGVAVAILKDGEVVMSRGFGVRDAEGGDPVDGDTVFEAASLSKPMFAYAVLKLWEEGRIDLDVPLTSYLDEPYVDAEPRLEGITARRVLAHSTGFPNWRPAAWSDAPGPLTVDFEPGERFSYSGEGYVYLQRVVEKITDMPLAEFMGDRILVPLGMTRSSFVWVEDLASNAALGHGTDGQPITDRQRMTEGISAGSLYTTASDYAKFLTLMLAVEEPAPDDLTKISGATLNSMLASETPIEGGLGWGLGWGLEPAVGAGFFWHWGDNGEFKAFTLGSMRDRAAVVVLTNSVFGLQICEPIVGAVIPRQHPAFGFRMVDYNY